MRAAHSGVGCVSVLVWLSENGNMHMDRHATTRHCTLHYTTLDCTGLERRPNRVSFQQPPSLSASRKSWPSSLLRRGPRFSYLSPHVPRAPPPSRVLFCHVFLRPLPRPACPCQVLDMNSGRCAMYRVDCSWEGERMSERRKFGSVRFRPGDKRMSIILRAALHGSV